MKIKPEELWSFPAEISEICELIDTDLLERNIKPFQIIEEEDKRLKIWKINGYLITQLKFLMPELISKGC